MKVWVTRDKNRSGFSCIWQEKPVLKSAPIVGVYYDKNKDSGRLPWHIEDSEFLSEFRFTPRKGSCKPYELSKGPCKRYKLTLKEINNG